MLLIHRLHKMLLTLENKSKPMSSVKEKKVLPAKLNRQLHLFFTLVPRHSFQFFFFVFFSMFVLFAQDLLYRRARALADYENSNKALDKARLKSKDIPQAEEHQQQCLQKFDRLSESGKKGLCVGMRKISTCSKVFQISQRAKHFKLDFVFPATPSQKQSLLFSKAGELWPSGRTS